jgi:hypothetical protein
MFRLQIHSYKEIKKLKLVILLSKPTMFPVIQEVMLFIIFCLLDNFIKTKFLFFRIGQLILQQLMVKKLDLLILKSALLLEILSFVVELENSFKEMHKKWLKMCNF